LTMASERSSSPDQPPARTSEIAENLYRKPNKSILKRPSIGNIQETLSHPNHARHQHYDEDNVKATWGPGLPDKDYGHQKIEEPKTPFHEEDGTERTHQVDQTELLKKLNNIDQGAAAAQRSSAKGFHLTTDPSKSLGSYSGQKSQCTDPNRPAGEANPEPTACDYEVVEDNDFNKHDAERRLSVDEKAKKDKFDALRKKHYNMKEQMMLARKMMEEEDDDED